MDPLTHTATGLFLSRAGLNRWTPRATAILILAANAPDIDIVSAAGGSLNYLHYHRHLTHSLMAMPVMALLPVVAVRLIGRKPVNWLAAWCASLIAVGSHLLLDWTNSYGIRLLLPFSARWLRLDWTNVIDLWIWAVLAICLLGPFLARLVGSEISSGAAQTRPHGRAAACAALGFLLFYEGARATLHARAVAALDSRLYQQTSPLRTFAFPDAANPFDWRGVMETSEFDAVAGLNLAAEFDPSRANIFIKPEPDPALDAARNSETFRQFIEFAQVPFWRVSPAPDLEGGKLVEVFDLRFGTPLAPGFMASATVDAQQHVVRANFQWGRLRPR
ncbi:MAG: metal-dependent hydrolase [Bryobacteraceae bacterium]|jgi:inner membrane protein